jgi:uncharacterized protein YkwD
LILSAVLLASCTSGSAPEGPQVGRPGWPPSKPRHPERLASAFTPGSDPLVWWKSAIFDSVPAGIYSDPGHAALARSVIVETNKTRAGHGLGAVSEEIVLDRVAQAHARDQAIRDYWDHKSPEGMGSRDRVKAASGIVVTVGGENSAVQSGPTSGGSVVRSFELHAGHRELLLNTGVKRIGVGVYQYAPGEAVHVVQLLMDY